MRELFYSFTAVMKNQLMFRFQELQTEQKFNAILAYRSVEAHCTFILVDFCPGICDLDLG